MDQSPPSAVVGSAPMRTLGLGVGQLLLCAATGVGAEPVLPENVGRGVHAASLLWGAQDDGVAAATRPWRGSQAGAAFTPGDGIDGGLCQAAVPIEHCGQIDKPAPQSDIGDVGAPHLVGPDNGYALEQIRKTPVGSPSEVRDDRFTFRIRELVESLSSVQSLYLLKLLIIRMHRLEAFSIE